MEVEWRKIWKNVGHVTYPLVDVDMSIENLYFSMKVTINGIVHSYVKLPEDTDGGRMEKTGC